MADGLARTWIDRPRCWRRWVFEQRLAVRTLECCFRSGVGEPAGRDITARTLLSTASLGRAANSRACAHEHGFTPFQTDTRRTRPDIRRVEATAAATGPSLAMQHARAHLHMRAPWPRRGVSVPWARPRYFLGVVRSARPAGSSRWRLETDSPLVRTPLPGGIRPISTCSSALGAAGGACADAPWTEGTVDQTAFLLRPFIPVPMRPSPVPHPGRRDPSRLHGWPLRRCSRQRRLAVPDRRWRLFTSIPSRSSRSPSTLPVKLGPMPVCVPSPALPCPGAGAVRGCFCASVLTPAARTGNGPIPTELRISRSHRRRFAWAAPVPKACLHVLRT